MPKFFDKLRITPGQKKPNPKKNFFENYSDHFDHLQLELFNGYRKFQQIETFDGQLDFLFKEALKRLSTFERLRDGYDYMDEVLGATVLPIAAGFVAGGTFLVGLWECAQALLIKVGLTGPDGEDHIDNAQKAFFVAAAAFVLAVASFVKSAVSMITRPIVTAVHGFAEQDVDRFHDEESLIGKALQ